MKKSLFMFGMIASLLGCSPKNIETVDVKTFESLIDAGQVQLVDARAADEFANGSIPGAINIDVQQADFMAKSQVLLKTDRPVAIYCRSGHRSMVGAKMLSKQNYHIYNLDGGIIAWQNEGKKTTR